MAEDFLDKLSHDKNKNKSINKQLDKSTTPNQKATKKKSIKIDADLYRKLKIKSAIDNEQMSTLANIALKYCFKHNIIK